MAAEKKGLITAIVFSVIGQTILVPLNLNGQVSQSPNYRIERDSINFGGLFSSSDSYQTESTLGETASGPSESGSFILQAGYRFMDGSFISISSPDNVTLGPSLDGVVGGTASGSFAWTVVTDSSAGYSLSIKAADNPALKSSSDSFSDYAPAGSVPDLSFSFGASASTFGFSPEGSDIVSRFRDNGTVCGAGSGDTVNACWDGFSVTDKEVARGSGGNTPDGAGTTIKLRAGIGPSANKPAGSYSATITATAVAL